MHHWNDQSRGKEQHFILQSNETLEYVSKDSYIVSGVVYRGEVTKDKRDVYIFSVEHLDEHMQAFCDKNDLVILEVVCDPQVKTVLYRPGMVTRFTNKAKAILAGAINR